MQLTKEQVEQAVLRLEGKEGMTKPKTLAPKPGQSQEAIIQQLSQPVVAVTILYDLRVDGLTVSTTGAPMTLQALRMILQKAVEMVRQGEQQAAQSEPAKGEGKKSEP